MKKILLLFLISVKFCYGQSPLQTERGKKLIAEYMRENLNDLKNYQPISTSFIKEMSTYYFSYTSDSISNEIAKRISKLGSEKNLLEVKRGYQSKYDSTQVAHMLSPQFENIEYRVDSISNSIKYLHNMNDSLELAYIPLFVGYVGYHKFRGGNKMGGIILTTWRFTFDKGITEIVKVKTDSDE